VKLDELTHKGIQQFAGAKIFDRGHDYYLSGNVTDLSYDPDNESLSAEVAGNYGDYNVEVKQVGKEIRASCNCPYDGYPCKHIVAVLLSYINHRRVYTEQAREEKSRKLSMEKRIRMLSHEELVAMVLECSRKYPDFKRELMVRFGSDRKKTLETIRKQVSGAFPSIESDSYSTNRIARELKHILQSVESADEWIRIEVHWAVADSILHELNEYGMDDDALEDVLLSCFEALTILLADSEALAPRRREIIGELMRYYNWGNFGMVDVVFDTVMDLCLEKQDYQVVIDRLESQKGSSSYTREQLAYLYSLIGDEEAELKVLQNELEYGMDYWRLAEYWLGRDEREKAMKVIKEGIEKGKGRKEELYDFLREDCERRGDYEGLARLLQSKMKRNDLSQGTLRDDPLYQSLKRYYEAKGDYKSRLKLLEMSLKRNEIDLSLYREAEKTLEQTDWAVFEKELFNRLLKEQKASKSTWALGPSVALRTLAEIYAYKGDLKQLYETVKSSHELLIEYEGKLLVLYPSHYLKEYRARVEWLISQRGRGNYQQAVGYLKKVRKICRDLQKSPEEWDRIIREIRENNSNLRALQEELRKARLIT
jgi:hypothetical protein